MYKFLFFLFAIELLISCVKGDRLTVLELELIDPTSQKPIIDKAIVIGQKSGGAFSRVQFDTLQTIYTNSAGMAEFTYITQVEQALQYRIAGQTEKGSSCLVLTENILEGIINKKQIYLYHDSVLVAMRFSKLKETYPTANQIEVKISNGCSSRDIFQYKSYQGSDFNPEIFMNVHTQYRVLVRIFEDGRYLHAIGYNISVEDQSFIFDPLE